mmetsp:Transcript_25861/g.76453  ORF Transcript_25861/g.76453 Transcript_25861/m.76453 type:complete len:500 (+) Transcript_25861:467-1966(+)
MHNHHHHNCPPPLPPGSLLSVRRNLDRRLEPGGGAGHGPLGRVVRDPLGEEGGHLELAQEPHSGVLLPHPVRVALRVPHPLGVLQHHILAGRIQGEDHVIPQGMRAILVHGGDAEAELAQREGRAGDARHAVLQHRPRPVAVGLAVRIEPGRTAGVGAGEGHLRHAPVRLVDGGVHGHAPHGRDGGGIGLKVEEGVPDDLLGGAHVQDDVAVPLPSHVGLEFDAFARGEGGLLRRVEFGEGEGEGGRGHGEGRRYVPLEGVQLRVARGGGGRRGRRGGGFGLPLSRLLRLRPGRHEAVLRVDRRGGNDRRRKGRRRAGLLLRLAAGRRGRRRGRGGRRGYGPVAPRRCGGPVRVRVRRRRRRGLASLLLRRGGDEGNVIQGHVDRAALLVDDDGPQPADRRGLGDHVQSGKGRLERRPAAVQFSSVRRSYSSSSSDAAAFLGAVLYARPTARLGEDGSNAAADSEAGFRRRRRGGGSLLVDVDRGAKDRRADSTTDSES